MFGDMFMRNQLEIKELFNLEETMARDLFEKYTYPWEVLPNISDFVLKLIETLDMNIYEKIEEDVYIAKSAKIYPNTFIKGPTIIGENTEVRPSAFIRGSVIVGNNCVVGNSTELKNVILFNNVQVPHFNYVGDSILGFKAHTGAGAITSNVKQDKTNVFVKTSDEAVDSKLKKFGAILGDNVEVGCNAVLNPGTVVGKNSRIYPLTMVRGFVPADSIVKNNGEIIKIND